MSHFGCSLGNDFPHGLDKLQGDVESGTDGAVHFGGLFSPILGLVQTDEHSFNGQIGLDVFRITAGQLNDPSLDLGPDGGDLFVGSSIKAAGS